MIEEIPEPEAEFYAEARKPVLIPAQSGISMRYVCIVFAIAFSVIMTLYLGNQGVDMMGAYLWPDTQAQQPKISVAIPNILTLKPNANASASENERKLAKNPNQSPQAQQSRDPSVPPQTNPPLSGSIVSETPNSAIKEATRAR